MALALDYQADQDAFSKQYDADQAAKATQDAQQKNPQPPSFLQRWSSTVGRVTGSMVDSAVSAADSMYDTEPMRKARDVVAGGITGATNMADSVMSHTAGALATAAQPGDESNPDGDSAPADISAAAGPIWDHAKSSILDFRDAVAVNDPTMSDNLTQGVAQLALPFAGFSRALSGVHALANMAISGALTDATALGPHDMRMADLIALGRHTEGKLGDALRALAPDGSAVNGYISYLADRSNESEAEGRFKNVLDGFGANLIATPLIHSAAMVLKQGTAGLRFMIDNGVGSSGGLKGPATQVGAVGDLSAARRPPLQQGADPAESLYDEQVRRDADAAAANPNGKRPPLVQGGDPAQAIYDDKVRQDVSNSDSAPKGWSEIPGGSDSPVSALEKDPAATAARTFLKTQTDAGHEGSLHAMVTTLGAHLDGSTEEGAFYKDILNRLSAKNLETQITSPGGAHPSPSRVPLQASGHYSPAEDTVALYPRAFQDNKTLVHTVAHEAVHAATMKAMTEQPAVTSALTGLLGETKTAVTGNIKPYGLTNVREFVAEAESNPKFQQLLKDNKSADGRPLWDHYREVLGGVFGLSGAAIASPMFDKLLTKEKKGA